MSKASEILNRKKPNEATCEILLDPGLATQHAELRARLRAAEKEAESTNDRAPGITATRLRQQIADLENEIRSETETFRFQGCGTLRFREMLEDCPPTDLDQRGGLDYEASKFGPRLIAACAVDPTFTEAEAEALWASWSDAEVTRLFNTAMAANRVVRDVPFTEPSTESGDSSGRNSTTAPPEESHTGIS